MGDFSTMMGRMPPANSCPSPLMTSDVHALTPFSRYQKFVVGLLATLQFAVIIDFMLMAPLGAMIMPALSMSTRQFGWWSAPTLSALAYPGC